VGTAGAAGNSARTSTSPVSMDMRRLVRTAPMFSPRRRRAPRPDRVISLLALLAIAACGRGGDGDDAGPASSRVVSIEEDLRIGSVEGGDAGFGRIIGLEVDDLGRIYVADGLNRDVRMFAPDGRHVCQDPVFCTSHYGSTGVEFSTRCEESTVRCSSPQQRVENSARRRPSSHLKLSPLRRSLLRRRLA
jgi:hypothetical protein